MRRLKLEKNESTTAAMRCRSGILEDDWCVGCKSWLHGFSLLDVFLNLWDGIFPVFQRPGIRSLAYRLYRVQNKVVGCTASWKFVETQNQETPSAFQTKKRRLEGELPARSSQWTIISCRFKTSLKIIIFQPFMMGNHRKSYGNQHPSLRLGNVGKFQPGLGLIQFHSPLHQSPLHIDQRTLIPTVSCRFTWSWVIFNQFTDWHESLAWVSVFPCPSMSFHVLPASSSWQDIFARVTFCMTSSAALMCGSPDSWWLRVSNFHSLPSVHSHLLLQVHSLKV